MYSIWRAGRAEWERWAVTRGDGGTVRPATPQELLDRNVVPEGVDARDEMVFHVLSLAWAPGDFPGRPVAAGAAGRRYARLASDTREIATRSRIRRGGGGRSPARELLVRSGEVRDTDQVLEREVAPFRVLGEK